MGALYWVARKDLLLTTTNGDEERRRRRGRLALVAALVHVAGPYLDNKVAQLREDAELVLSLPPDEAGDSSASSATANTVASRARAFLLRALVRAHPVVKLGLGLQDVWSRIRFTANLSRFATLEHWLVEMPVGRLTPAEWNAQNRLREAARARWLARARGPPPAPGPDPLLARLGEEAPSVLPSLPHLPPKEGGPHVPHLLRLRLLLQLHHGSRQGPRQVPGDPDSRHGGARQKALLELLTKDRESERERGRGTPVMLTQTFVTHKVVR